MVAVPTAAPETPGARRHRAVNALDATMSACCPANRPTWSAGSGGPAATPTYGHLRMNTLSRAAVFRIDPWPAAGDARPITG